MGQQTRSFLIGFGVLAALCVAPRPAQAGGIEDTVSGTQALGRGAHYARVRDFMAVWQNPANLAVLPDKAMGANLRVPVLQACFQREKDLRDLDGDGEPDKEYIDGDTPYAEVCDEAGVLPAGSMGFAMPINKQWGFGVGLFTPAGIGGLKFGSDDIQTKTPVDVEDPSEEQLEITNPGDPSPARWLLIEREVLAAYLMGGVGYAPLPQLRLGISAGAAFADVSYKAAAAVQEGDTGAEFLNDVSATDWFIPRIVASLASTPVPGLDLAGVLTWNDDITAKGHVDVTANGLQGGELGDCSAAMDPDGDGLGGPGVRCRVNDIELDVPYQRFQVMLAARYGMRRAGVDDSELDPFVSEVFDIEINGYWEETSRVDTFSLKLYDPQDVISGNRSQPGINPSSRPMGVMVSPFPPQADLPHKWRDTYGVRLGGDYNALPGVLAVRAGVGYETRGTPKSNMSVDYWPVQKVVLHLGGSVRFGPVDLHIAYAHSFNETVVVPVGEGKITQVVAVGSAASGGAFGDGWAANEGKFTSSIDILSLGASYRF